MVTKVTPQMLVLPPEVPLSTTANTWTAKQTFNAGAALPNNALVELGTGGASVSSNGSGNLLITSGTNGSTVVAAAAGTGLIYWRPNGSASVVGQASLNASGVLTATSFSGPLTGTASTATALATARTINGTSFNGSANITTANWGTSRTITLGSTGKAVDGSAAVTWTLAEMGAASTTALATTDANVAAARQRTGKNFLINSEFKINQRGFAGGALGAGLYGYDRWKAGASGCSITANATTGVITHTSGGYRQWIESPGLANKQVMISVEDPSGSVTVGMAGATAVITAGAGRRGVAITVPGAATGDVDATFSATGVTYARPQVEIGDTVTAFEYRPAALELDQCLRYYEKSYDVATAPGTAATSAGMEQYQLTGLGASARVITMAVRFKVPKRVAPTFSWYSYATGTANRVRDIVAAADVTPSGTNVGQNGISSDIPLASATAINAAAQWTADAEI